MEPADSLPRQSTSPNEFRLRTLADLPCPERVPFLGNAHQIDSLRFHLTMEDWARQFGPLYKFHIAGRQFVVTSDSDTIATLLRDRPDVMRRSSPGARILEEAIASGVFNAEGEEWRKQRKLVMRALTPEVIHNFFPTLVAMTERLHQRWRCLITGGYPVNVLRDLKAYTLDVTVGLALGQDINTLEHEDNPLQRDIDFLFNRVARRYTSPFPYWRFVRLPIDRAADASSTRIKEAIIGFIAQTRKRLHDNPGLLVKPSNMLEALIVARDEPNSEFNDSNVIGNAITMVFAGEDTTSNSVAWLLDFLVRHPQEAARVASEASDVLSGAKVLNDFHKLSQLEYLEAATREAMRLKPVAPFLDLETNKDIVIADVSVPAGTIVICMLRYSAERNSDLGHPNEFRPGRWLSAQFDATASDPAHRLFPFGAGPRFCPGRYLAMAEIKMVMSMLAKNFELALIENAPPVNEVYKFTMNPSALPLQLRLRLDD